MIVQPTTSLSQLNTLLEEIAACLASSSKPNGDNILNSWKTIAEYYKERDVEDFENLENQFALEIFIIAMIGWLLKDIAGSTNKCTDPLDFILDITKKPGISFDSGFYSRIKYSIEIFQSLDSFLDKLWSIMPTLDLSGLVEEDLIGSVIQDMLPAKFRKSLAANYTSIISAKFLAALSVREGIDHVIDPFSGSGRLLTALIEELEHQKSNYIPSISLNELLDLAAYISTLRVIYSHCKLSQMPRLSLHLGDAFSKVGDAFSDERSSDGKFAKANMVIMNPPFTRYLRLSNQYLKVLKNICGKYQQFMSPQMGLHVFSLFLADSLLMPGGRIAAILPAPTFYSNYSNGLKKFLLSKYQVRAIVGTSTDKSFSEGSDLKEIMLVADKLAKNDKQSKCVLFATLNEELTKSNFREIAQSVLEESPNGFGIKFRKVSNNELKSNWNWIKFLEHNGIHSLAGTLKKSSKICTAGSLNLRIVRGFEMYGPDFFFLPNKDWLKEEENDKEVVFYHRESRQSLKFPREIMLPALRKPSLYSRSISPSTCHYILRVPEGREDSVPPDYVEERRSKWRVAESRFGKDWLHHIDQQLNSKRPFGYLFTVDKFGITTTGTIIHYFDEEKTASKNFYLIDCNQQTAKLLAAWMSSTFFILMFLAARREIGGAFGRLQISDYLIEPIFLDTTKISKTSQQLILSKFDEFRAFELPPLRDQIGWQPRNDLDRVILNVLQIDGVAADEFLQEVYTAVLKTFEESDVRGQKRRGRD